MRLQSRFRQLGIGFLLMASLLAGAALAGGGLKVGDVPPDKLGKTASGDVVHLSEYRGKIVIISFWASWCTPCLKELPVLAAIQKKATREKIVVLAVNWRESAERFRDIKHAFKDVDLTLVSDERGYYGNNYGVEAIPHMIVVGRDGRIAAVHVGYGESEIPAFVDEINALWLNSGPDETQRSQDCGPKS